MKHLGQDSGTPDLKLAGFQMWIHGWESDTREVTADHFKRWSAFPGDVIVFE